MKSDLTPPHDKLATLTGEGTGSAITWRGLGMAAVAIGVVTFGGCALPGDESSGVEKFRQPIPEASSVEVPGPETSGGEGSTASFGELGELQSTDGDRWAAGPWAKYYGFTRAVRLDVNIVTAAVLGTAWALVHAPPSSVTSGEAIWGPWTDALSPVTWRFRVTEVEPQVFEYVFEGRPKASTSENDYRAVLFGSGYGRLHPKHGDGTFEIDLDVSKELDPFHVEEGESGSIAFTHTLSQPEKVIDVRATPSGSDAYWGITSTRFADGSGQLVVNAHDNLDDTPVAFLEDIQIASRWTPEGAGRAEITLSGGDVPIDVVTAVECWDTDFYRSYYSDSFDWEPEEGSEAACPSF